MALTLGHVFLWFSFQYARGNKDLEKYLLQLVRQWFYIMKWERNVVGGCLRIQGLLGQSWQT